MASNDCSQTIEDLKVFINGLRESFLIPNEMLESISPQISCSLSNIQKKIIESPASEKLRVIFEGEYSNWFILLYLGIPLNNALIYLSHNTINLDAPYIYYLKDSHMVYEQFKTIKRIVRVEVYNYLCKLYPSKRSLIENAILELDEDSMKELLNDDNIKIDWLRNWMGLSAYCYSFYNDTIKGVITREDINLIEEYVCNTDNIIQGGDQLYASKRVDARHNHVISHQICSTEAKEIVNEYWSSRSIYRPYFRQVIDDYINKPCFSKFVSECWTEFKKNERQRAGESDSETDWLPDDFFSDNNLPDINKSNWLRGLKDAVVHGWYKEDGPQNDEEKKGDGKQKIIALINECAKLGYIPNDNFSKAKMAYVLTGRNVGFDVDEQKPISWKTEYKNCFYYLVKYLFEPVSYKNALSVVDGVGQYPSKVSSRFELELMENNKTQLQFNVDPNRLPGLADEPENKDFRIFVHNLYEFCPDHRPKRGEGKHTAPRPSKKKDNT